ncbi:DUF1775 domain-containing protein [Streptomyces nodosus]|uniref:DUF1775 domain-containing protein n=1 Tax=Streptomyces nodosus TaxID=40318 RepID=UPI00382B1210
MFRRTRRHVAKTRLITAVAGAAGTVLLVAGPSAAHVRVIGDVIPGKPATLMFRVPSELADATTVRITVVIPPELTVASVPDLSGWTEQTVAGSHGRPTQLVWTAEPGQEIRPGNSRIFKVKVGPVPDQYALTFDTEQTYSNGTTARWDQKQTGSEEPEFPAPVLVIDPDASPSPGSADAPPQQSATEAAAPGAGSDPAPSVAAGTADASPVGQTGLSGSLLTAIGAGVAVLGGLVTALLRRSWSDGTAALDRGDAAEGTARTR